MAKKIKRELDCLLTREEKATLGIKACEERDKARDLKEQASALEKSAKEKEHQVATGLIKRMVECVEDLNFVTNAVTVTRTDDPQFWPNGHAIVGEPRAMTGEERQLEIDGAGGGDGAAKVTTKSPKGRGKKSTAPN